MNNGIADDRGWLFAREKERSEIWKEMTVPDPARGEDYQYEWLNVTTGVSLLLTFVTRIPNGPREWALYRFKLGDDEAYDISHFLGGYRVEDTPERFVRYTHDQITGADTLTRNDPA